MELTRKQGAKIEEIASGLKCSKDFKCCESGFEELCRAVEKHGLGRTYTDCDGLYGRGGLDDAL